MNGRAGYDQAIQAMVGGLDDAIGEPHEKRSPRWSVALLRLLSPPNGSTTCSSTWMKRAAPPARSGWTAHWRPHRHADMAIGAIRARGSARTFGEHRGAGLQGRPSELAKSPGLTIAGGLALAIAIGVGAAWFDVTRQMWRPTIPLPEGDRIVEIEMRDPRRNGNERRIMHDYVGWRRAARSVTDLGAYRTVQRNLVIDGAQLEPVTGAEITASALALARVPPLLGRPLLAADERPGAAPVVVLGYTVWQRQYGGRPGIVGQPIRIGRDTVTVVGVMPEGFAFPVHHRLGRR